MADSIMKSGTVLNPTIVFSRIGGTASTVSATIVGASPVPITGMRSIRNASEGTTLSISNGAETVSSAFSDREARYPHGMPMTTATSSAKRLMPVCVAICPSSCIVCVDMYSAMPVIMLVIRYFLMIACAGQFS